MRVTSQNEKEYDFHIYNNNGASSSIYEQNDPVWYWPHVVETGKIKLKSIRLDDLLSKNSICYDECDAIIDVQGAELEVLKGAGIFLSKIKKLTIEVSKEQYYKEAVLFNELNTFLTQNGFKLDNNFVNQIPSHGDVVYYR